MFDSNNKATEDGLIDFILTVFIHYTDDYTNYSNGEVVLSVDEILDKNRHLDKEYILTRVLYHCKDVSEGRTPCLNGLKLLLEI